MSLVAMRLLQACGSFLLLFLLRLSPSQLKQLVFCVLFVGSENAPV